MFAAAAVATLFQAGPIGAQLMSETRISTAIIPVEHVVVRTKKPYIEVKAALENSIPITPSERRLPRKEKPRRGASGDRRRGFSRSDD
jgi:hypothetical protein